MRSEGDGWTRAEPPSARWLSSLLASGPASISGGVRFAVAKLCHPDLAMVGVVTWWAFNIGVLYASFRAFGDAPPLAVLVQAYFVGMLANLLPLPGGIGVVDGGMIGAFVAFGVSPEPRRARGAGVPPDRLLAAQRPGCASPTSSCGAP